MAALGPQRKGPRFYLHSLQRWVAQLFGTKFCFTLNKNCVDQDGESVFDDPSTWLQAPAEDKLTLRACEPYYD